MFSLLSRIPHGLDSLRNFLEKYVENVGMQAVQNVKNTAINVFFYFPS